MFTYTIAPGPADERVGYRPRVDDAAADLARTLLDARRDFVVFESFPGDVPSGPDAAYAVQDAAIALRGGVVPGWKIGAIAPARRGSSPFDRLVAPAGEVVESRQDAPPPHIVVPSSALLEGEYLVRFVGGLPDAPQSEWTAADVLGASPEVSIGLEICGSAIADINSLGPWATIADLGNNVGVVAGPVIDRTLGDLDDVTVELLIDGVVVGTGSVANIPGGVADGVAQLGRILAARGIRISTRQVISTGSLAGAPPASAGQTVGARFAGLGDVECVLDSPPVS